MNLSTHPFLIIVLLLPFIMICSLQTVLGLPPVADLTGKWSGTAYSIIDNSSCELFHKVSAVIKQKGNDIEGTISLVAVDAKPLVDGIRCNAHDTDQPIEGRIDGSRITLYFDPDDVYGEYKNGKIRLKFSYDNGPTVIKIAPVGFTPQPLESKMKKDTDGDGIPDHKDKCPKKPETFNGFEDEDGCPDKKPKPTPEPKPSDNSWTGTASWSVTSTFVDSSGTHQIVRCEYTAPASLTLQRNGDYATGSLSLDRVELFNSRIPEACSKDSLAPSGNIKARIVYSDASSMQMSGTIEQNSFGARQFGKQIQITINNQNNGLSSLFNLYK
jgi:hypothetical protein